MSANVITSTVGPNGVAAEGEGVALSNGLSAFPDREAFADFAAMGTYEISSASLAYFT